MKGLHGPGSINSEFFWTGCVDHTLHNALESTVEGCISIKKMIKETDRLSKDTHKSEAKARELKQACKELREQGKL
jgi:hypothetical protein